MSIVETTAFIAMITGAFLLGRITAQNKVPRSGGLAICVLLSLVCLLLVLLYVTGNPGAPVMSGSEPPHAQENTTAESLLWHIRRTPVKGAEGVHAPQGRLWNDGQSAMYELSAPGQEEQAGMTPDAGDTREVWSDDTTVKDRAGHIATCSGATIETTPPPASKIRTP